MTLLALLLPLLSGTGKVDSLPLPISDSSVVGASVLTTESQPAPAVASVASKWPRVPLATSTDAWALAGWSGALVGSWMVEQDLRDKLAGSSTPVSRGWAASSKILGDGRATLPAVGLAWWIGHRQNLSRLERSSQVALESWVLAQLATQTIKYGAHRHRPLGNTPHDQFEGPGISSEHLSFPSGHTTSAFSMASAYALELQEDSPWWAATVYLAGASCAASRVHDGEHWLTDVVFSMGISYASARTVRWWHGQKMSNKPSVLVVPTSEGLALQSAWTF